MRRFILLTLLTSPVAAQQAIPDTIVTGTRIPTAVDRVPAATTTITRTDIEEFGYRTLADALAIVPGLRVVPQGGPGTLTSGFLRGTNSRHVQVLIDGVTANDASDPSGAFNFGSLLLAGVERIEVLRGPASSLYGSSAIGGVVNIVTRRAPADKQAEVFGSVAGGTQSTLRADGGVAGTVGAFDYLFTAQTLSTQGFDIIPRRIQPHRFEADGYRGAATVARLGWTPMPGTRIEGTLRWQQANYGVDRFLANDPNYSAEDRRWSGQLRAETRLFDVWTTGLRVGFSADRRRAVNFPDQFSSSRTDDLYRGERTVVEWGNQVRLPNIGSWAADGALGFGASFARETARTAAGNAPFRSTVNASQDSQAGFLNLQYRVLERLDLSAGGRADATTGFGVAPTYRLGAVYAIPELNARLRAAVGSGFAAPSLFQRFGIIGTGFRGNPDLRPERSTSWEVGGDIDVAGLANPRLLTVSATYFRSFFRDLINSNAAFTSNINVARANIEGAELGLTARLTPWAEVRAAYTLTRAFDSTTDRRLLRRPENVLALSGRVTLLPGLTIAPEILLTGRSPDFVYDNLGRSSRATNTKGGTTANVTVTYQVMPRVAVFLEGRNLGNSRFEPTSGYVVPGRSVLLGTRFTL